MTERKNCKWKTTRLTTDLCANEHFNKPISQCKCDLCGYYEEQMYPNAQSNLIDLEYILKEEARLRHRLECDEPIRLIAQFIKREGVERAVAGLLVQVNPWMADDIVNVESHREEREKKKKHKP